MTTPLKVADQFRENKLSFIPGGYTVVVVYQNGKVLEYDKIKNPIAYMTSISKNLDVKETYVKK